MCLAVKRGTPLSLLTLPSLENGEVFSYSLSLFVQHFTGKICVLVSRKEPLISAVL